MVYVQTIYISRRRWYGFTDVRGPIPTKANRQRDGVFYNFRNLLLNAFILFCQHLLDLESSHTTTSSTRDRLPVPLILDVASGKHPPNARLGCSGDSEDVTVGIDLKLVAYEGRGGLVADGVEKTRDRKILFFTV